MRGAVTYDELVELSKRDDGIIGLVLTGSRGRGFAVTDDSDWDVRLVVRDDVRDEYRERFGTPHGSRVEVVVLSLTESEAVGAVGSSSAWDRYSYVDAEVAFDEDGTITRFVREKGVLPADEARAAAAERLDDYVNAYYRAAKNARAALEDEARLDASESILPLLDFLFATHERVRPFNRFLRWELERRPLPDSAFSLETLFERLAAIGSGDLAEQQRMFRDVEALARAHGHGNVLDGWEPDVAWLRGD
jgi:predicted nucleotidyltransferase